MKKKETDADAEAEAGAEESARKKPPGWLWVVVLVIVCALLASGGFYFARHTKNDKLSLLIYSLIVSGIVWGIYHLAMGIKRGTLKSRGAFTAILVSMMLSTLYGYSLEIQEEERLFDERKALKAAEEAKRAAAKPPEKAAAQAKTGDVAEFETFAAPIINKAAADRSDYLREMEAMGWSKIIDPPRVNLDKGFAETRAMLQKAKDIMGKYRARHTNLMDEALKGIAALKVSEPSRQKILRSFDGTGPNSTEAIGALWDHEVGIVTEYEAIFALLTARKGNWSADSGRILFTSKADLGAFNGHLDAIAGLAQKIEALRTEQREAIDNTFAEPKAPDVKGGETKVGDPNIHQPAAEPKPGEAKGPEVRSVEVKFGDPSVKGGKK